MIAPLKPAAEVMAEIEQLVARARRHWREPEPDPSQRREDAPRRDLHGTPATYGWVTGGSALEGLLGADAVARLRAAVRERPRVLTIWGERSGVGKTASAVAASRALSPDGRGQFVRASALVESMREMPYGQTSDVMARARSTVLLVLDDLGIEAQSEQAREWLCELVWRRADHERPGRVTIVTTSLSPDQVSARYGDGMSRRLFQAASIHLVGVAK